MSTYLLVAILKKTWKLEPSLHEILQVISVTPFEKIPLAELFARQSRNFTPNIHDNDVLNLFS